jgi:hypothetical protein
MLESAIILGVFGLFGFFLAAVSTARLNRLEARLRRVEHEQQRT